MGKYELIKKMINEEIRKLDELEKEKKAEEKKEEKERKAEEKKEEKERKKKKEKKEETKCQVCNSTSHFVELTVLEDIKKSMHRPPSIVKNVNMKQPLKET